MRWGEIETQNPQIYATEEKTSCPQSLRRTTETITSSSSSQKSNSVGNNNNNKKVDVTSKRPSSAAAATWTNHREGANACDRTSQQVVF